MIKKPGTETSFNDSLSSMRKINININKNNK